MSTKPQGECCPKFDPTPWDGKVLEWNDKKFIKGEVCTLFYMPLNFGSVITRLMKKIEASGAEAQDWMSLSDHTSMWNMDVYVAISKEVPNAENVTLSGKFLAKTYEGDFKDTGKWMKDFAAYATGQNMKIKKTYMWYTTCPKCAKKWGKNYTVVFGQVA